MAKIVRHPNVADYILEMSLDEIAQRPSGLMDLFEDGKLVVVKNYRLPFDFSAMEALDDRTDSIDDQKIRRKLKKLEATTFFSGKDPEKIIDEKGDIESLRFDTPLRQALFASFCRSDPKVFANASNALRIAHDELTRIFKLCFPTYETTRLISSLRLTETVFENLHWDNHSIDDDFHQARIFCNLDRRKRIWNVGDRCIDFMEANYAKYDLAQFAGRDPNEMLSYIAGDILGGTRDIWKDDRPRHHVAFEPGEVWLGESRMISHQIWYGQRAMVYMWFVNVNSMHDKSRRFNARVEDLHARMAANLPSSSSHESIAAA